MIKSQPIKSPFVGVTNLFGFKDPFIERLNSLSYIKKDDKQLLINYYFHHKEQLNYNKHYIKKTIKNVKERLIEDVIEDVLSIISFYSYYDKNQMQIYIENKYDLNKDKVEWLFNKLKKDKKIIIKKNRIYSISHNS